VRKIIYLSGTRADFGLFESTLLRADASPELDVSVCVTGMHLDPAYGSTVDDIEASGIRICGRIPVDLTETSGGTMARSVGHEIIGLVGVLEQERPDLLMVLGDRGEMLGAAIAAVHLNIPVVHLHGGERSGTVDELLRHAITKLSHFHFVATEEARDRLIRMGEYKKQVHVTGAPGLDGIRDLVNISRKQLCEETGLDPDKPLALVVFHPVVQQADRAAEQTIALMEAVLAHEELQAVVSLPNADAGGGAIRVAYRSFEVPRFRFRRHFSRNIYLSWVAAADVMVGNSSSGIIEAASLGTVVVNVGNRQKSRERGDNVIDVGTSREAIQESISHALGLDKREWLNVYGDGCSGKRIVSLLETLPLDAHVLEKTNAY